jgi:hypothetical protein
VKRLLLPLGLLLVACPTEAPAPPDPASPQPRAQWTVQQAEAWQDATPWLVGFNYAPRTASNQLEMWQETTWDPATIDDELGWAADLGFNTARVFLHDLLWDPEAPEPFLARIDSFLEIADGHGIGVMLVFFDGVWNPVVTAGVQPEPTPGVHNSTWVQSPGAAILGDSAAHDSLEPYVKGVIGRFRTDPRVHAWDLFNEADNPNFLSYGGTELPIDIKSARALALMSRAFDWARAMDPVQPLTAGVFLLPWAVDSNLSDLNRFMLSESDVNSFHTYLGPDAVQARVAELLEYGRPLLCTEYMARPEDSTFEAILPIFEEHQVGAYSWGLVNGRTQTIHPWTSWLNPSTEEPDPWFHDILREDGQPFDEAEAVFLRELLLD